MMREQPPTQRATSGRSGSSGERRAPALVELGFELPIRLEAAFRFFSDPRNLNRVTPDWFALRFLDTPPGALTVGSTIDYRLRWRFIPLRWRSVITEWRPPRLLTYEQARGPYRYFRHEHLFRATPTGTHIQDRIAFRPPAGFLSERLVRAELYRILRFRARVSRHLLEGPGREASGQDSPPDRDVSRIPLSSASSSTIEEPR